MKGLGLLFVALLVTQLLGASALGDADVEGLAARVQQAMVKLYGAGQVAGLEGYQTGFFIQRDPPLLVTVDSTVLEGGRVSVVDSEGERFEATLLGRDGPTGLALLEAPANAEPPETLLLEGDRLPRVGASVWVISNAFGIAAGDEPLSLQRGRVVAVAPLDLSGGVPGESRSRVGVPAEGTSVLVLSAVTSNPGAAGGAVVSSEGALVGVVGAECRSPTSGAWLNYALPASAAAEAVERLQSGEAQDQRGSLRDTDLRGVVTRLGLSFLPAVTERTPAYIETVRRDGPAASAGLAPDDLVIAVDGVSVGEVRAAISALALAEKRRGQAEVVVLRDKQLITLSVGGESP